MKECHKSQEQLPEDDFRHLFHYFKNLIKRACLYNIITHAVLFCQLFLVLFSWAKKEDELDVGHIDHPLAHELPLVSVGGGGEHHEHHRGGAGGEGGQGEADIWPVKNPETGVGDNTGQGASHYVMI